MCSFSFCERGVETQAGFDADSEQVERVGEVGADALLPAAGLQSQ